MKNFLRWLVFGSNELVMPKSWLDKIDRLNEYERWTLEQRESYVTKDTAWFRRQAFWQALENKPVSRVGKFPRAV